MTIDMLLTDVFMLADILILKLKIPTRKTKIGQKTGYFTDQPNEFLIGWKDTGTIAVAVQSHSIDVHLNPGYNMEDLWTNWRKHCFTWKAHRKFKVGVFSNFVFFFRSKKNAEHYQQLVPVPATFMKL